MQRMNFIIANDSPVLVLLVPPGEYDWIIRQLPVRNMISTPNLMFIQNQRTIYRVAQLKWGQLCW